MCFISMIITRMTNERDVQSERKIKMIPEYIGHPFFYLGIF